MNAKKQVQKPGPAPTAAAPRVVEELAAELVAAEAAGAAGGKGDRCLALEIQIADALRFQREERARALRAEQAAVAAALDAKYTELAEHAAALSRLLWDIVGGTSPLTSRRQIAGGIVCFLRSGLCAGDRRKMLLFSNVCEWCDRDSLIGAMEREGDERARMILSHESDRPASEPSLIARKLAIEDELAQAARPGASREDIEAAKDSARQAQRQAVPAA